MPSHEADNCRSLKTNNKVPDYGRRKNYMDNFIHILLLAVTADKPNPDYGSQDKNKHKRACRRTATRLWLVFDSGNIYLNLQNLNF